MNIKKLINQVVIFIVAIVCSFNPAFAQDSSKVSVDLGTDMVSRYVWRGTQFGGRSPNIQPFAEMGIGNFVFGTWGAYTMGGTNRSQELDFYAGYSFLDDKVSMTVTDYYFPGETSDYQYFDYGKNTTGHVFEATASFNGTDKIPFSALIATNFYGADATRISDDPANLNNADGIQYSTYMEIGFASSCKSVDLDAFLGINLTAPRQEDLAGTGFVGESGFYGDNMGVVNLGFALSKEIEVSGKFNLPVMVSVITNPQTQKMFMVFGFSL
ncbi:MAG: hypothetical protein JKX95_04890 [Bacteroidia bacterium]|nr:hypothetical protein [Bacteroidia bacterium]